MENVAGHRLEQNVACHRLIQLLLFRTSTPSTCSRSQGAGCKTCSTRSEPASRPWPTPRPSAWLRRTPSRTGMLLICCVLAQLSRSDMPLIVCSLICCVLAQLSCSDMPFIVCSLRHIQQHIVPPSHRVTETQRHRDTEQQRHIHTELQRHKGTETQRIRDNCTQRQRHTDTPGEKTTAHEPALIHI